MIDGRPDLSRIRSSVAEATTRNPTDEADANAVVKVRVREPVVFRLTDLCGSLIADLSTAV
jgi:hypothetical protein